MVASIQLAMALSRTVYNQTNSFKDVSKVVLSKRLFQDLEDIHNLYDLLWILTQ